MSANTQAIAYNFIRYPFIIVAAAIITLFLFYSMQLLIQTGEDVPQEISVIKLIDTTVPIFDRELIVDIEPPEPFDPPVPPIAPPGPPTINTDGPKIYVPIIDPVPPSNPSTSIPFSPGLMVPLIRTTPNYPSRAASRGIEGFVELSFTVDELGNVVDPVVLNAHPEGYFENAALQSIKRWRYSPATENGSPIPTFDVRQRIVFQMEDSLQ